MHGANPGELIGHCLNSRVSVELRDEGALRLLAAQLRIICAVARSLTYT